MSPDPSQPDSFEPQCSADQIDAVCDRFEAAWKSGKQPLIEQFCDVRPSSEGSALSRQLVVELVIIDLQYRWRVGIGSRAGDEAMSLGGPPLPENPRLADYVARYPILGSPTDLSTELIVEEYRIRHIWGDRPNHAEYADTFGATHPGLTELLLQVDEEMAVEETGVHSGSSGSTASSGGSWALHVGCPNCHVTVEVVDEDSRAEICCGACGHRFRLVNEDMVWQTRDGGRQQSRMVGHFELLERLGIGSFGTVWKARDTALDRVVALKIPRKGELSRAEAEKFLREARAAAQLSHPNIVSVHEVGRQDDKIYIVSDFVEGHSLDDWIEDQRLTFREAATMCMKIAGALHYAHEVGVIHRDLKPSNIMVDGGGEPHIMDFGLAKRERSDVTMTVEGQILGTPAYMSPEQAKGEGHQADRRTDIYSLGVILFRMLTGELPFRGNVRMLLKQVVEDEPPAPRKFDAAIPRDLETICLKCLEKDVRRRYASAEEVRQEFERFTRHEAILARPVSRPERFWRWCRRNPVVAGLSATALMLLATVAIVASVGYVLTWQALEREADQRARAESQFRLAETARQQARAAQQAAELAKQDTEAALKKEKDARDAVERAKYDLEQAKNDLVKALSSEESARREAEQARRETQKALDQEKMARMAVEEAREKLAAALDREEEARREAEEALAKEALSRQQADLARQAAERSLYFNRVALAQQKWLAGDVGHAESLLDACPDELRHWEWGYLKGLCHLDLATLEGHDDHVLCAAVSPDGHFIASGGGDRTVRIWDAQSGEPLRILNGHDDTVTSVAFSNNPNKPWLASGGNDQVIRVWDYSSGKQQQAIHEEGFMPYNLAFSPDGSRLVAGALNNTIRVWNVDDAKNLLTLPGQQTVQCIALSPDGKQIASVGQDGRLKIVDALSGEQSKSLSGHDDFVLTVCFSSDGKKLATGSVDCTAKLWDVASGEELHTLRGHAQWVLCATFSPDGKTLATSSSDHTVRLWDVDSGEPRLTLRGHGRAVRSVAFSPDGRRVVTGSYDHTVKIWDATDDRESSIADQRPEWVRDTATDPGGTFVAEPGEDNTLIIRSVEDGKIRDTLSGHDGEVLGAAFSPDSDYVASASADRTVKIWSLETGKPRFTLEGHTNWVTCVAYSPDGRRLVTGSRDRTVRIWDTETGREVLALREQPRHIVQVAVSPNGQQIAAVDREGTIRIWKSSFSPGVLKTNRTQRRTAQRRAPSAAFAQSVQSLR